MALEARLLSYDWTNNFEIFQNITKRGSFMATCTSSYNTSFSVSNKSIYSIIKSISYLPSIFLNRFSEMSIMSRKIIKTSIFNDVP